MIHFIALCLGMTLQCGCFVTQTRCKKCGLSKYLFLRWDPFFLEAGVRVKKLLKQNSAHKGTLRTGGGCSRSYFMLIGYSLFITAVYSCFASFPIRSVKILFNGEESMRHGQVCRWEVCGERCYICSLEFRSNCYCAHTFQTIRRESQKENLSHYLCQRLPGMKLCCNFFTLVPFPSFPFSSLSFILSSA